MTDITGADVYFTNIDVSLTQTQWETFIDEGIDLINGQGYQFGIDIPNMTGTAGAKTWSGLSAEAGFIRTVAVSIYLRDYKNRGAQQGNTALGPLSLSSGAGSPEALAREAAEKLRDLDLTTGADASF